MSNAALATVSTIPAPPSEPIKVCSCCWQHISDEEWRALEYVGMQSDGDDGWLELRTHGCGSTLAREVGR